MPKRKIRDSLLPPDAEAAALAALREAYKHPSKPATERERERIAALPHVDESTGGWAANSPFVIAVDDSSPVKRRGKLVYRTAGKAGADLPVPPFYMEMLKRQRDFEAECAKVDRELAFKYLHQPQHSKNAEKRAQCIRELAKTITGHGSVKAIARKAGCSVDTVRRALKRSK